MSGVKHNGTLNLCILCLVCKDDSSNHGHGDTRFDTDMFNTYNESKAVLDDAVILQTRGQKILPRIKTRTIRQSSTNLLSDYFRGYACWPTSENGNVATIKILNNFG